MIGSLKLIARRNRDKEQFDSFNDRLNLSIQDLSFVLQIDSSMQRSEDVTDAQGDMEEVMSMLQELTDQSKDFKNEILNAISTTVSQQNTSNLDDVKESLKQAFDQIRLEMQNMNADSLKLPEYYVNSTREISVRLHSAIGSLESAITTDIKGHMSEALATLARETKERNDAMAADLSIAVGDVHASVTAGFHDHGQQLEWTKASILKAIKDIRDDNGSKEKNSVVIVELIKKSNKTLVDLVAEHNKQNKHSTKNIVDLKTVVTKQGESLRKLLLSVVCGGQYRQAN